MDDKNEESTVWNGANAALSAEAIELTQLNKFHTKGGTGFAAEEANAMADHIAGKTVEQVGTLNQRNGADRIADGIHIQTKYFDTASRTLNDAFDSDSGKYRYSGQQLEVPRDQYDDCVLMMKKKILAGNVDGVTDPDEAANIVKKGDVTYQQARNIARPGNIDSAVFDAKQQCVASSYAFGLSFLITYARARWDGQEQSEAISYSLRASLSSGLTSFVAGVFARQVLRTRSAALGVPFVKSGVRMVYQSSEAGKAAITKLAEASLGKAVYGGAALNHVSKLLRSNAVTGAITTVVVSTPDFYRAAFTGSISWAQFSKNVMVTGASVAAGAGGWMAGAAAGATAGSVVPGLGTAAGAFIGGLLGSIGAGYAGSAVSKTALDYLIEDDAKEMVNLLPGYLEPLAEAYLLSREETDALVKVVQGQVSAEFLRDMYASSDRGSFVTQTFESACLDLVAKRVRVHAPDPKQVQDALDRIEAEALSEASEPEVIVCEAGCGQKLRLRVQYEHMEVTCPTCRGTWERSLRTA